MAKAQGIIGNFKGKIGNTVGYQLTSSNNKQTQGIRIYQPNVKNPKTSAQAEQRAKLAPINATYRALKMIIDRGNEGLPYGNKSRLAWLKQAFKTSAMPWYEKGAAIIMPVGAQLTKGSLPSLVFEVGQDAVLIICEGVTAQSEVSTFGQVSTLLKAAYPFIQDGDQITIVGCGMLNDSMNSVVVSFLIDPLSVETNNIIRASAGKLNIDMSNAQGGGSVILSREGANGEHLRSTSTLVVNEDLVTLAPYDADSKTAAIKSYMTSGTANTDWAEESIQ